MGHSLAADWDAKKKARLTVGWSTGLFRLQYTPEDSNALDDSRCDDSHDANKGAEKGTPAIEESESIVLTRAWEVDIVHIVQALSDSALCDLLAVARGLLRTEETSND